MDQRRRARNLVRSGELRRWFERRYRAGELVMCGNRLMGRVKIILFSQTGFFRPSWGAREDRSAAEQPWHRRSSSRRGM